MSDAQVLMLSGWIHHGCPDALGWLLARHPAMAFGVAADLLEREWLS